ncbi:MAG TPA: isoleucine--tRNA ligase [Acidimicrobiales bacterium]|nr:isoleucine--tRNA ligase [Acidimicrobiales bacterium]
MCPSRRVEAPYPDIAQRPSYSELELAILDFWERDQTFRASVKGRVGGTNEFVFYDGPPFANGLPHYGHLLTGFVKDAVPRYQTMRGHRVERRFGWDCHGLPAEMEAEKELEVSGRAGIVDYGIESFNSYCRTLVLRTTDSWERYVTRQARWVDFANDYKTMDLSYMESVLWAFKQLWEKGLVYEGERVLPFCWECETPLSNFETRQDDAYRPRGDPAVTVGFDLDPEPGTLEPDLAAGPLRLLVWTTTPWTLPSNLALAVGPDISYDIFDIDGKLTALAHDRVDALEDVLTDSPLVQSVLGSRLIGRTYRPLFDFFAGHPRSFVVLGAQFVATDEGTGIVHLAPGFGEDDYEACQVAGIELVCPVDSQGRFTSDVERYSGTQVFDANQQIVEDLDDMGALVGYELYTHSYPHCWRTDTPLIYKAVSSWFVSVTTIKDRMVELNEQIDWVPEHVRDGAFGKWLEGARDWSISRNRFWGAPIPVWKSDDAAYPRIDVYGSLDEIERDFGIRPDDLHRPAVDELTRPNPDDPTGRSTMRRVEDVLDCWFESGSMPFAQVHYPFERSEWFESHFPADFIVEYVGQTRGWFYTLHVLSTALFDCPPFQHCVAHGIVLGDDGRKMSKRLGNYPEPDMVFDMWGADAMRWFLLSSPVLRGQDLVVHAKGMEDVVLQVLNPIWSAWYFFTLYANADGIRGKRRTDQRGVLDRYALAKTASLVEEVTSQLDSYDLFGACSSITAFLDALNNWYIRRSRTRFWRSATPDDAAPPEENGPSLPAEATGDVPHPDAELVDKIDAYDTLTTVLETLCRVAAPLLPLLTESIYRDLTGERSVHLADWPLAEELPIDRDLVDSMDLVRDVCSAAHAVRKASGRRARLPLSRLVVASPDSGRLAAFTDLIRDEVNVKDVELRTTVEDVAEEIVTPVPAAIGPRLGPDTQKVITALKRGDWLQSDAGVVAAGIALEPGEYELVLRPVDEERGRTLPRDRGVIVLDTDLTPDLEQEGIARDVVRSVQSERREKGLHITDRIVLVISGPEEVRSAIEKHRDYVMEQTLAVELELIPALELAIRVEKA